jgi:hypothetical protein
MIWWIIIIYVVGCILAAMISNAITFGREMISMTVLWPLWILFLIIKLVWEILKLLIFTIKEFIDLIK